MYVKHAPTTILRIIRASTGQRLDDVAAVTQIPTSKISKVELAEAALTQDELRRLAECYRVPLAVLRGEVPFAVLGVIPVVSG
jgi:hypothetical protein